VFIVTKYMALQYIQYIYGNPLTPTVELSIRMPGCQKLQMTAYPGSAHVLYSCTHMATVDVKGLMILIILFFKLFVF